MHKLVYLVIIFLAGTSAMSTGIAASPTDSDRDIERLKNIRYAFDQMQEFMVQRPDLFPARTSFQKQLNSREQREEIWGFWKSFLDRLVVLDAIGEKHSVEYASNTGDKKAKSYHLAYATFLLQYRRAVEFIAEFEKNPAMHTTLNEPVPELGLAKDIYTKLKFRFLNIARATQFVQMNTLYSLYKKIDHSQLSSDIETDRKALWKLGIGAGTAQTVKNAFTIIKDSSFSAWFPIQARVSEWMGNVKVYRTNHSLISKAQISEMQSLLKPGDILLERREWYLSNVGLPGYWPHAALYIGTEAERRAYFSDIDNFESTLKYAYPVAYADSQTADAHGQPPRIIEAISEGVSFTTLEHSVDADSVAILRPNLSKQEKAKAIKRAFHFSGRPYDFNFDFLTDAELVCTELIYKAYEPSKAFKGLNLPARKVMGRTVTTANDIVKMFDIETSLATSQLDFIAFYDGHERKKHATRSNQATFQNSWKRPKGFIWVQDTVFEPQLFSISD